MTGYERRLKLQRRLMREADKLKKAGTDSAINILQVLPVYVLAFKYGFGNVRLEKFITELYRLTEKVKNDEHLLVTMINELEHDKGILIDIATGDVDNVWRDEGDTRQKIRKPRKKA